MKSPTETPASKVVCESQDCGKEYASKGGMKNHYKKTHKSLEEIQSPLGKFPAIDPARILFNESDPSTQGNSKGQVNSPKVTTCGQYICNICDNYFESKQDIDEHKKKEHDISSPTARETDSGSQDPTASSPPTDTTSSMTRELYSQNTVRQLNVEDNVMEDAKKEQELYEQIFQITENVIVPEKEEETREELKEKMIRFKMIKDKKEKLHEQTKETVNILEEKIEYLKHECTLSSEVEVKQRKEIEDISKTTEKTRKNLNEKLQENAKLHKEKDAAVEEMNTLRETNGTLSKTNYDLKTKLKTKDDLIKAMKESNDAQENDASEESNITVVQEDISHKCQQCNKT